MSSKFQMHKTTKEGSKAIPTNISELTVLFQSLKCSMDIDCLYLVKNSLIACDVNNDNMTYSSAHDPILDKMESANEAA